MNSRLTAEEEMAMVPLTAESGGGGNEETDPETEETDPSLDPEC